MSDTRFTIRFTLDAYECAAEFEGDSQKLRAVIQGLKAAGCEPTAPQAVKQNTAPLCPVHGKAMKVSTARPGSYFCPVKDESTGAYCKQKSQ